LLIRKGGYDCQWLIRCKEGFYTLRTTRVERPIARSIGIRLGSSASARVTVRQTKDGKGDHASNPEEKGCSSTVCRCQSSIKDVGRVGW
jgi:hypothetical protein